MLDKSGYRMTVRSPYLPPPAPGSPPAHACAPAGDARTAAGGALAGGRLRYVAASQAPSRPAPLASD